MADYSITITNSLRCFGLEESTKWGDNYGPGYTMVWGTSTWGYGYTIPADVQKLISEAINPTWDYSYSEVQKLVENSVPVAFETDTETLTQGIWDVVFVSNTTDAEERDFATWTSQSAGTTSFTCGAAGSTTWSES